MNMDRCIATARAWQARDPDPETRLRTAQLLAQNSPDELEEHFGRRLAFGTAGLRAEMGPGPNRMNRVVVRQVAAGLADAVRGEGRPVVIGWDARRRSRIFAEEAAAVLAAQGIDVFLHHRCVPTPILAYSVTALGCAAGLMITASHNPAGDNGIKIYGSQGSQVGPPDDRIIDEAIQQAQWIDPLPPLSELRASGRVRSVPAKVIGAYRDAVLGLRVHSETGVRIVYTALHGVGLAETDAVLRAAGHHQIMAVPGQCVPDGGFPTVGSPNPEDIEALALAMRHGREVNADVVLAHDPDADRLAVVVPDKRGDWRILSGNEIGMLLAEDLLRHGPRDRERLIATTVVSTGMLNRIADSHGDRCVRTLTGFKWIARQSLSHEAAGGRFVFGCEEAMGYCIGSLVRDKDGISAALLIADLVAWLHAQGRTVSDALEGLARQHGLHLSGQRSVRLPGASGKARMQRCMDQLRQDPPTVVGGVRVVRRFDAWTGEQVDCLSGQVSSLDLPQSNVIGLDLADGSWVRVRPSGTEPKIKFYFEVREQVEADEKMADCQHRARVRLERMMEDEALGA